MDLKWPEMPSKVNFGHPKWPINQKCDLRWISDIQNSRRRPSLRLPLLSFYGFYAFPWHFSGIIWHPGGMPWNSMAFHGIPPGCHIIPWMLLFPWNFSGILWHPGGMPWNSMECHGRYVISMELQCNSMASRWNAMEFHGIQKIGTLTKLVSGSKQWKYMEFGQQNGCQQ